MVLGSSTAFGLGCRIGGWGSGLGAFYIVLGVEGVEVILEDWASCWARNSLTYLRIA